MDRQSSALPSREWTVPAALSLAPAVRLRRAAKDGRKRARKRLTTAVQWGTWRSPFCTAGRLFVKLQNAMS